MRCCPPAAQPAALAKFDQLVRSASAPSPPTIHRLPTWLLSGLATNSELDPAYPADLTTHPDVLSAVQLLNAHLETAHHITPATGLAKRQQDLSRLLD